MTNNKKQLKLLKETMAQREDAVELEAQKEVKARAKRKAELDNQAVIEASKPKPKKKIQAEEKKK